MSDFSRSELRRLKPGQTRSERGVVYERLDGDGRWSINVMVNRVRHHQVVGLESEGYTRTQAEDVIAALKAKKRETNHGVVAPAHRVRLSIAKAVDDYLEFLRGHDGKDLEAKTRRFEQHIVPHLGKIGIDRLTDDDWSRYVASRRAEGASNATINRERSALLHMLHTALRRKQLRGMPCLLARQKEPPGKISYLSPDQLQRLIKSAKEDQSDHALPFVMIAGYTGMRHASVLNLRARDIDCDQRVIWIGADKAGRRQQPMPSVLAEYLRSFCSGLKSDQLLFGSKRAESGRVYQINSIFGRCIERAGLSRDITPHSLRHTVATNAAHAGLDAATIQAIGGWKTRQMAERYTHAASMADAMARLENQLVSHRRITPKLHGRPRRIA